jgi:hypothetical protein
VQRHGLVAVEVAADVHGRGRISGIDGNGVH